MKKILIFILTILFLSGCTTTTNTTITNDIYSKYPDASVIKLEENKASLNGEQLEEYDYIWHINTETGEEYYSGNITDSSKSLYLSHDIIYYPQIDESSFVKEEYNKDIEWVNYYKTEELKQYVFSTLPVLGEELPTYMMHSEEEAYDNIVLHINEAGSYILEGSWYGQIAIDLGEDSYSDENKKVTLILNGVNVVCDVAPALIFYNVYEVDNNYKEKDIYTDVVDLTNAGAKIIIVDGTENNFTGANIFRILKPEYTSKKDKKQESLYKIDGAVYSFESLLIDGEEKGTGILNITSTTYEGLDTELHLTINSGYINIVSQDDGINVNEDDVSVFTMNGGRLTVFAGQGAEGDVIDSNGYIKINGGTILGTTPSSPDEILDSGCGTDVSENAIVISSGEAKNNLNIFAQNFNKPNNDFDPNNFNPNQFPQDFDPSQTPNRNENPPEKPNMR